MLETNVKSSSEKSSLECPSTGASSNLANHEIGENPQLSHLSDRSGDRPIDRNDQLEQLLRLAVLKAEKCEIDESFKILEDLLSKAREQRHARYIMESLAQLSRLAVEAQDIEAARRFDEELNRFMIEFPGDVSAIVWIAKATLAKQAFGLKKAMIFYRKGLRAFRIRKDDAHRDYWYKLWTSIANSYNSLGRSDRALVLADSLIKRLAKEPKELRGVSGSLFILRGYISETRGDWVAAKEFYQKAFAATLTEHNWFVHLYVLLAYSRVSHAENKFEDALWYLDMIEKAIRGQPVANLREEVNHAIQRLKQDEFDITIDLDSRVVKTRDGQNISLKNQYILLQLLDSLSKAHVEKKNAGLSKAEIIQKVWEEKYRPEAHDNKLYYNINRLRKIVEKDAASPKIIMSWKEGYRFAPGLRVELRTSKTSTQSGQNSVFGGKKND